jgi:septal ring factor EnvC (AmiA/AmiB activator)
MKDKAPIIVLIIVAAGLGVGLIVVNNKARREKQDLYDQLTVQSNNVTSIKASLTDQQAVNQALETNLATTRADYSNKLAISDANLRSTQENLDKATAEAKAKADAYAADVAQRDKKISDLEAQNLDLDKQAGTLRGHIDGLQSQIAATQDKLSKSEGDRDVLLKELKRLQSEKTVWENRFNDLAVLQAQVKKLKADLTEARILDWTRRGIYESNKEKGGERLISQPETSQTAPDTSLKVELHQAGGTNIVAPVPSANPSK